MVPYLTVETQYNVHSRDPKNLYVVTNSTLYALQKTFVLRTGTNKSISYIEFIRYLHVRYNELQLYNAILQYGFLHSQNPDLVCSSYKGLLLPLQEILLDPVEVEPVGLLRMHVVSDSFFHPPNCHSLANFATVRAIVRLKKFVRN